jgi:hypothetical protein
MARRANQSSRGARGPLLGCQQVWAALTVQHVPQTPVRRHRAVHGRGAYTLQRRLFAEDGLASPVTQLPGDGIDVIAKEIGRRKKGKQGQPDMARRTFRTSSASRPTVHRMIVTLHDRGLIQARPGQPRSITLLVPPEHLPPLQSIKIPATGY